MKWRPFPTTESVQFKGHTERIRSITMSPSGEYFATGSDDHTVRVWEVSSGRCVSMWNFGAPVYLFIIIILLWSSFSSCSFSPFVCGYNNETLIIQRLYVAWNPVIPIIAAAVYVTCYIFDYALLLTLFYIVMSLSISWHQISKFLIPFLITFPPFWAKMSSSTTQKVYSLPFYFLIHWLTFISNIIIK